MAEEFPKTAKEMVLAALEILRRGLPGGGLDDRQVVTELWGVFDNPEASRVYRRLGLDLDEQQPKNHVDGS